MVARRWSQVLGTLVANPWFAYFGTRTIYQGSAKGLCFPGFNCYACPLALFSCPIGALQQSFALLSPRYNSASASQAAVTAVKRAASYPVSAMLYVVGFIGLVGVVTGRLVCGWICPFGFLQDLLYKIPTPKLGLPQWMRFGKYFCRILCYRRSASIFSWNYYRQRQCLPGFCRIGLFDCTYSQLHRL